MRRITNWMPCVGLTVLAALTALPAGAQGLGGFGRPTGPVGASPRPAPPQGGAQPSPRPLQSEKPGGGAGSPMMPSYSAPQGSPFRPIGPLSSSRPVYTGPTNAYPSPGSNAPFASGETAYRPSFQSNRPQYQTNGNAPVYDNRVGQPSVRVTTPVGPRSLRSRDYYPIYGGGYDGYSNSVTVVGGPTLLGGYYYGGYTQTYTAQNCVPSIYSVYSGFPQYIYSPASVVVVTEPYAPIYVTGYQPFYTPSYPVVYNENIYYVGSEARAEQIVHGNAQTRRTALSTAYPDGSFQAAFGDIERAWQDSSVAPLRKHLRGDDVKISVFFKSKYSYSIASSDFQQITRDAFDKLSTVSFKFNRLRKAKNGDVTAYGTHRYRAGTDAADSGGTVPFSTDGPVGYDNTSPATSGVEKTVTVSYTLHKQGAQWNIIALDSTPADTAN